MMTIIAAGSIFWVIVLYIICRLAARNGENGMQSYCNLECGEFWNREFQARNSGFENPVRYRAEREHFNNYGGVYNE